MSIMLKLKTTFSLAYTVIYFERQPNVAKEDGDSEFNKNRAFHVT